MYKRIQSLILILLLSSIFQACGDWDKSGKVKDVDEIRQTLESGYSATYTLSDVLYKIDGKWTSDVSDWLGIGPSYPSKLILENGRFYMDFNSFFQYGSDLFLGIHPESEAINNWNECLSLYWQTSRPLPKAYIYMPVVWNGGTPYLSTDLKEDGGIKIQELSESKMQLCFVDRDNSPCLLQRYTASEYEDFRNARTMVIESYSDLIAYYDQFFIKLIHEYGESHGYLNFREIQQQLTDYIRNKYEY